MNLEADVVVIGSGAFGASTAYHLTKLGKKVVLVEKRDLVSQTSPRAAGMAMQVQIDDILSGIAIRSIEKIVHFTEETGQELEFHQSGSIKMARKPGDVELIHDEVERGKAMGVEIEHVSREEAQRLAPHFQSDAALALWYAPKDLYLEPSDLPRGYLRAAEGIGAILLPRTTVTSIRSQDGVIEGVVTDQGEIRAPVVVDGAGAWTRVIADILGIRIPLVPTRHQLYITKPIEGVTAEQPTVRVIDAKVYVRPARGGLMVGGYEPDPLQVDVREKPADFQIADLALDFEPLRKKTEEVRDQFPVLVNAQIAEFRGGLPTMTPDGLFIIDRVPTLEGFFVASGCNVGGLSTSPALGEALASWIVTGQYPPELRPFRMTRFGPEMESEERIREACFNTYAHKYSEEEVSHTGSA